MKNNIFVKTIVMILAVTAFGAAAFGQDAQPTETPQLAAQKPVDMRSAVLGQLSLSREQIQRIRRLNMERKPLMETAQARLRDANRLLDEAIYADQINESDVQSRLKEAQLAQAEVARIRFMKEFAVRRILTPEQLVRFRDLRQKFEDTRQNMEKGRPPVNEVRQVNGGPPDGVRPLRDTKQQLKPTVRPNQQRPLIRK